MPFILLFVFNICSCLSLTATIGDYVDRGPHSVETAIYLSKTPPLPQVSVIPIILPKKEKKKSRIYIPENEQYFAVNARHNFFFVVVLIASPSGAEGGVPGPHLHAPREPRGEGRERRLRGLRDQFLPVPVYVPFPPFLLAIFFIF